MPTPGARFKLSCCIWYVSKYVAPPSANNPGGRGFLLMKELARQGHRAVIITSDATQLYEVPAFDGPYLGEVRDGVQFLWLRTLKFKAAKSVLRILSFIDFEWRLLRMPKRELPRPDAIVVSSLSLLTILNGVLLRRKYRCRLVFEIRDIWPLTLTEEGGFSPSNPLIKALGWVERYGYRVSDAIIGTMPNLGEHVSRILGRGRRVDCIPMGVPPGADLVPPSLDEAFVRANGIPSGKFLVAYAGTIGITNALDPFFLCAQSLRERGDIHFLCLGDGDMRKGYMERFGGLPNLTFIAKVPRSMVQSVLARADLLYLSTHPSEVWRYGQSLNKLIDYMCSGKPIVASYTGFPSMINEADCGTFIPAGDVAALAQEVLRFSEMAPEHREEIGRRGRCWILENRSYDLLGREFAKVVLGR
jgi:glycosyltransferase involved in cell wall biosynthesis